MKFATIVFDIISGLFLGVFQLTMVVPAENMLNARNLANLDNAKLMARGRPKIPGCKDSEAYYLCKTSTCLAASARARAGVATRRARELLKRDAVSFLSLCFRESFDIVLVRLTALVDSENQFCK